MVPRGAARKDVPHACWLVSPVTDGVLAEPQLRDDPRQLMGAPQREAERAGTVKMRALTGRATPGNPGQTPVNQALAVPVSGQDRAKHQRQDQPAERDPGP